MAAALSLHWTGSVELKAGAVAAFKKVSSGRSSQLRSFQVRVVFVLFAGSKPKRGSVWCSSSTKYQPGFPSAGLSEPNGLGSLRSKPKKLMSVPI